MADPRPSWLTRVWLVIRAIVDRFTACRDAQTAADTAATQRNEDAEHAVQRVEDQPPVSPTAVSSRMRDGTF